VKEVKCAYVLRMVQSLGKMLTNKIQLLVKCAKESAGYSETTCVLPSNNLQMKAEGEHQLIGVI